MSLINMDKNKDIFKKSYFFRKLRGQIYAICFCKELVEKLKIKEQVYYHIMKALFFYSYNYKNRFVNFIEDRKEISIFLDKHALTKMLEGFQEEFKQYITIDNTIFKAFEIFCDGNDLLSPGITSFISTKLAEQGISIIYTNSYNNSYILVAEKDFIQTCEILKNVANDANDNEDG